MELGPLRIFIKPSQIFRISSEIKWREVFIILTIPAILFSFLRLLIGGGFIFFISYMTAFYSLSIFTALLYAPIYYLFLRDYYSLKDMFKGVLLSTYPLFFIGSPSLPLMLLGFLLFHVVIFLNIFQVIKDPLECLLITIFPGILLSILHFQRISF